MGVKSWHTRVLHGGGLTRAGARFCGEAVA